MATEFQHWIFLDSVSFPSERVPHSSSHPRLIRSVGSVCIRAVGGVRLRFGMQLEVQTLSPLGLHEV